MYSSRSGFSMCSGLNLPTGSHHSAAIAWNLATSARSMLLCAVVMLPISFGDRLASARRRVYSGNMDRLADRNAASSSQGRLYPQVEPFDQRLIARDNGHHIHVEQCGNPEGGR